ncbi:hypothetical protein MRB53_035767 [Persea americana]|uniref:Uncharacterized protein n=1 Tax=Persea americana TaxID=3435 RepID=A0ACC2K5M4_PERAE|nr:hypothetical protein MRB53_035767 [Persea americana]
MLSVSPFTSPNDEVHEKESEKPPFSAVGVDDFSFDDIDFDDLFVGIDDGDVLPDLEVDSEMFAELSATGSDVNLSSCSSVEREDKDEKREEGDKGEEKREGSVSRSEESTVTKTNSALSDSNIGRKPATAQTKGLSQGKRKVKVDWTPELHRRFVQAVEQLGVDKAVPSRILELMGIDCLTRHNIASHLQKYRSHRKHLLAREAEAVNWTQRRHVYGGSGGGGKRNMAPWIPPTVGFPPPAPLHPFRPLHVWGHPTVDHSLIHVWPKHIVHSPSPRPPPPTWVPPPPADPSYWHPPHQRGSKDGWVPNMLTQGTPCFPQPLTTMKFSAPLVPGIPPHSLYKPDNSIAIPSPHMDSHLQLESHPTKETVDAAVGDVLAKPWLPLPLGLKPPSMDSVLMELQRQGVPKVPSFCA